MESDKKILLIEEYSKQREELHRMVEELERLKTGVEKIFPERLDARYSRFFEEKIKTVTELFKAILDIRKEITKSIKDEIDLRNKYENGSDGQDDLDGYDIRLLAKRLEQLNKSSNDMIMGYHDKSEITNNCEKGEKVNG
jgi:hypothetical protein